ncbi:MAG: hypothetical protein J1E39_04710 [Eubacterium sp.]|nr:hypothetical protein [Eubacterium sp.]
MKKTAAILSAIAVMACAGATAYAESDGGIIGDVISGAEDVVDGVVSGAEDVVDGVGDAVTGDDDSIPDTVSDATIGDSDSIPDSSDESSDNSSDESSDDNSDNSLDSGIVGNENVNTGVPALELAALGAAAVGGLAAMAVTVRRKK